MDSPDLYYQILLSFVFGAILGLETEIRDVEEKGKKAYNKEKSQKIGGVRTYAAISLFGSLCGIFFIHGLTIPLALGFLALISLISIAYAMNVYFKKAFGITTEVAIFITFLLGFLLTANLVPLGLLLFILIIITFFLSQKEGVTVLSKALDHNEFVDIVKFALLVLVILPLLPNQTFVLGDVLKLAEGINLQEISSEVLSLKVINPARVWSLLIVILGINLGGYLLNKFLGNKKGLVITALIGGFISSTSSTIAFAQKAKNAKSHAYKRALAGAAIASTGTSFITSLILFSALNTELLLELLPAFTLMTIAGVGVGSYFILTNSEDTEDDEEHLNVDSERFALLPALKFVGLITGITLLIQVVQLMKNDAFVAIVTSITGFTGLDAATVASAELFSSSEITLTLAVAIILMTNIVNLIAKVIYGSIMGERTFAKILAIGLATVGFVSVLGLF